MMGEAGVVLQWGSLATVLGLAMYVGRKAQQIEMGIERLSSIAKVVDEHCARLAAIEARLEERRLHDA